jgi:hypothetical protein
MSDDADLTQERLEKEEAFRRKYRQEEAPIKGTGFCLNCGEAIRKDWRWCNAECRDDYEYRSK